LEAALRTPNLRKLVLYEPAFPTEGSRLYPEGSEQRFQDLLDDGEREQLLVRFFREIAGMSDPEIDALRSDPSWQGRIAAAHTVVRELGDGAYVFAPERFTQLTVPTLLLHGSDSPPALIRPTRLLATVLPESRIVVMAGQGHVAMTTAPEIFLQEVISFLIAESDPQDRSV
jgi:pimeloyl-ACP methyl ester carboxylesterase